MIREWLKLGEDETKKEASLSRVMHSFVGNKISWTFKLVFLNIFTLGKIVTIFSYYLTVQLNIFELFFLMTYFTDHITRSLIR